MTGDSTHTARAARFREASAVVLVLAAATGIRMVSLPNEAVWYDEIATLDFLDAPTLPEFLRQTHAVTPVPPGYSITQFYWSRAFGDSILALRALSLVYGVVGIGAIYAVGRTLFSHRAGLIAAAWMTFVFWHVYHSQEIRFYSMATMLSLVMIWSFVRLVTRRTKMSFAIHALLSGVTIWTLPLAAFLFPVFGLYLLAFHRGQPRLILAWTIAHLALGATLVVFLVTIDRDVAYAQTGWLARPTLWRGYPSVRGFLAMGAGLIEHAPVNDAGAALLPWRRGLWIVVEFITFGGFGVAIAMLACQRPREATSPATLPPIAAATLLGLWFVLPPALAFVASYLWQPIFQGRYLLFAYPPLYLGLGWLLSRRSPAMVAITFTPLILFGALFYFPGPFRTPYDVLVRTIQSDPSPLRDVYVDDMIALSPLKYYWQGMPPEILGPFEMEKAVDIQSGRVTFGAPSNWLILTDEKRARYMRSDLRRAEIDFEMHYLVSLRPIWLFHATAPPLPETPNVVEPQ